MKEYDRCQDWTSKIQNKQLPNIEILDNKEKARITGLQDVCSL